MANHNIDPRDFGADAELADLAQAMHGVWSAFTKHRQDCTNSDAKGRAQDGTPRQGMWVMGKLGAGPLRMSELAEAVGASLASTSGVVDRLAQRDLVRRAQSSEDRRVVTVELTEAGRAELLKFRESMIDRLATLVDPLEPAERTELARLLRKLTQRH